MKKHKKTIKLMFALALAFLFGFALLSMPESVTSGVKNGLFICSAVLIPSLFPFLMLSGFLASPVMANVLARLMHNITRLIFKLPGHCGSVILLSAFGGFPIGARMTASLYQTGKIKHSEAKRLMRFCINAGPAFLITAVGSVLLGSHRAGLILFASTTISMFCIGFISSFCVRNEKLNIKKPKFNDKSSEGIGMSLTRAVSEAIPSMLTICAWVILFACLNSVFDTVIKNAFIKEMLALFTEVSIGAKTAATNGNIPLIALISGFGGFCVHFQLLSYLQDIDMPYYDFFIHRLLSGLLSLFIAKMLLFYFPVDIGIMASTQFSYEAFSVSIPSSLALLFLCVVLICSFPKDEYKALNNVVMFKNKRVKHIL